MFSTTAMRGSKGRPPSPAESSRLQAHLQVSGRLSAISSITGRPILPPTSVARPPARSKSPPPASSWSSLPFDPCNRDHLALQEIATGQLQLTRSPACPSACTCLPPPAYPAAPPGETTIRSCRRNVSRPMPPCLNHDPGIHQRRNLARQRRRAACPRSVTRAPFAFKNNAAAEIPLLPAPTTSTRYAFHIYLCRESCTPLNIARLACSGTLESEPSVGAG